jgi:hypothetical protein
MLLELFRGASTLPFAPDDNSRKLLGLQIFLSGQTRRSTPEGSVPGGLSDLGLTPHLRHPRRTMTANLTSPGCGSGSNCKNEYFGSNAASGALSPPYLLPFSFLGLGLSSPKMLRRAISRHRRWPRAPRHPSASHPLPNRSDRTIQLALQIGPTNIGYLTHATSNIRHCVATSPTRGISSR